MLGCAKDESVVACKQAYTNVHTHEHTHTHTHTHTQTLKQYDLKLDNPKEFYHECHRPAHFMNFTTMEEVEQAADADHEDFFN